MIKPSVKIEVLISGSWVDLSSDVQRPISCEVGIGGVSSPTNRTANPGKLEFQLDNSARNSVSTLGYYSPDHASALSGWEENLRIRAFVYHASYNSGLKYQQFDGWIDRIIPDPLLYLGTRSVTVIATDYIQILTDFDEVPLLAMLTDAHSPDGYRAVVDSMAVKPAGTAFVREYVEFDGSLTSIIVDDHADLQDLHSADFTAEIMARPDGSGEGGFGHLCGKGANTRGGWRIYLNGTTSIAFQADFSTTDINQGISNGVSAIFDGDFHHIAAVFISSEKKFYLYIDGDYKGVTAAGSGTVSTDVGNDFAIGTNDLGAFSFDGGIGWVRLSDFARYTENFEAPVFGEIPEPDGDTIALWRMDDASGGTAAEAVSGHDGTITSGTWSGYTGNLDPIPYIFHRSGERSGSGYEEINRICLSVFDYVYVNRRGYFRSEHRDERIKETSVTFSLTGSGGNIIGLSYTRDRSRGYDRIIGTTHPVLITSDEETAFELDEPIRINPGDSYTLVAKYSEPSSTRPCGLVNPVTLAAGTNVSFGSIGDGSAFDLNADIGISANFYSAAAEIVLTNNGNRLGFVNQVEITGNLVRFYNPVETAKTVNASGTRNFRYDLPYQDSTIFTENANEMIANVYNQSSGLGVTVSYRGNTLTEFGYFITGDIGKRIRISETVTGASSFDCYINKIKWTLDRNGEFRIEYQTAPASTTTNGIWGTSKWNQAVWQFAEG